MKTKGRRQSKNVEHAYGIVPSGAKKPLDLAAAIGRLVDKPKRTRLPRNPIGKKFVAGMTKAEAGIRKRAAVEQARYKPVGKEMDKPDTTTPRIVNKSKAVLRTRKPGKATATRKLAPKSKPVAKPRKKQVRFTKAKPGSRPSLPN